MRGTARRRQHALPADGVGASAAAPAPAAGDAGGAVLHLLLPGLRRALLPAAGVPDALHALLPAHRALLRLALLGQGRMRAWGSSQPLGALLDYLEVGAAIWAS